MLLAMAMILVAMWLLGSGLSYSLTGLIYLLLAVAIVAVLAWIVKFRSMV